MILAYECKFGQITDVLESEEGDVFRSRTQKDFSLPVDFIARHASDFVLSADGEASVPTARFHTLRDLAKEMFKVESGDSGTYTIRNVPIYKAHPDTRRYGIACNRDFLDRMVRNFYATTKATAELFGTDRFSWRPKVHYGHTPDDPDIEERENAGFLDNLFRVEDFLVADYVGLDKSNLERLTSGKYPDRSAEVDLRRGRLLSVAALGYRTPHFALPQMTPQELRKQYLAVIQKNSSEIKGVESHIFLKEDFSMPSIKPRKTNRQRAALTPEDVAKFFMELGDNEELNTQFEEACEKHCGMMGGMPQGMDLMSIIQQLMQSQMANKMNSSPPGQGGQPQPQQQGRYSATDLLDMESTAHHGAGEEDLDEEGTEVAEGKQGEDANVKKDGQPDVESPDYDTVSSGGKVVSKHLMAKVTRAKHTLKTLKDTHTRDQLSAVLDEVGSAFEGMSEILDKQHNGLLSLEKEVMIQKNARRKTTYLNRLQKMFSAANPNVASTEKVAKHLKFVMGLDDADAEQYLSNLEDVPALPTGRHVSRKDVIQPENSEGEFEKAKHTIKAHRGLKSAGITPAHLVAVERIQNLLSPEDDSEDLL